VVFSSTGETGFEGNVARAGGDEANGLTRPLRFFNADLFQRNWAILTAIFKLAMFGLLGRKYPT